MGFSVAKYCPGKAGDWETGESVWLAPSDTAAEHIHRQPVDQP
jgi:hypothetical protein